MSSPVPDIPVGTHSFDQLYLYAFATQAEVKQHIRTNVTEDDQARLEKILNDWEGLQAQVAQLLVQEQTLADRATASPIPAEGQAKVDEFAADDLFQKTFGGIPIQFGMVQIDDLVAAQRTVNLDYVRDLRAGLSGPSPSLDELLDVCVSPTRALQPIQHLEVAPNVHVFSSPNSDLRFLGAFLKPLTPDDMTFAEAGGLPAAAVISFIGYGGAPINILRVNGRNILNNGFHRVYALREHGLTEIPVVIQNVTNWQLEVPPAVAGLPREYLIGHPRPVLMKDFFEEDFGITLKVSERIKMIMLASQANQHDVPS